MGSKADQNLAADRPEKLRRSERVFIRIPIEVKGKREDGKPFRETNRTVVINRNGARIALRNSLRPEDRISITNLQNSLSCPFRVVGRTSKSFSECPEWGVECLEPGLNLWGITFPNKLATSAPAEGVDALLECSACGYRELAQLTLELYRELVARSRLARDCPRCVKSTDWKFGFVEEEFDQTVSPEPEPSGPLPLTAQFERRRAKRLTVKLPVRVRLQDGREEVAKTENISKTGVCFSSSQDMKEGDWIRVTVGYSPVGNDPEMPARVVWRRPLEGGQGALYGVHVEGSESEASSGG